MAQEEIAWWQRVGEIGCITRQSFKNDIIELDATDKGMKGRPA
jgi:hypothetical protein